MELYQQVKQYYFDNIRLLPPDKQFHYATRLAAWEADSTAFELLRELKNYIVPDPSEAGLHAQLEAITNKPRTGKRNAHNLREPYFIQQPRLYGIHSALFRVRHLECVYGIDAREALFELAGKEELDGLASWLMSDDQAVRSLSTFAVNFLYLYLGVVLRQKDKIDPQHFIDISRDYDLKDKKQLQLMIYLFTHCIIGESNFYIERLSENHLDVYRRMLKILEPLIGEHFQEINLDNKLEFLVACRICGIESELAGKIYAECQVSLSPDGHFLIDRHNSNPQTSRAGFAVSEHRNVLFIMSWTPYSPNSTLV